MKGQTLTQAQIADFFGVERSTVLQWAKRGMPALEDEKPKRYGSKDVINWYVAWKVSKAKPAHQDYSDEMAELKIQKLRAEVTMSEIELDEKAGKLVSVDDVLRELDNDYTIVRTNLLTLPSKLAAQAALIDNAAEIQELLTNEIFMSLEALTREEDDIDLDNDGIDN